MKMVGRAIKAGKAEGGALVSRKPISFYGGFDLDRGIVTDRHSDIYGQCVKAKVLVFPTGKGSTVGSYALYRMVKGGVGPAAIIMAEAETIVAVGAIISDLPCVDQIDISRIKTGDWIRIDGNVVWVNE